MHLPLTTVYTTPLGVVYRKIVSMGFVLYHQKYRGSAILVNLRFINAHKHKHTTQVPTQPPTHIAQVFTGTHFSAHRIHTRHRHAQNASFVAACPKNMHTDLRPRTKVRINVTLTHSLTHSFTHSLARTHSPSRSLTPTHSHIGVSHLLAAGAGSLPLPSVHAAVVESLGGVGFRRDPSTQHQSEP